jgi:multidrug resistance efflux pump
MKDALDKARAAFEPVKLRSSGDPTRKARKEDLDNAQSDYNSAVRRLQLSVTLSTAQARLNKAMNDLAALEDGPKEEDLTLAQARINAAEKALASAQAALDNLELTAPLDGVVVSIEPIVGEEVAPNQPVISLADFSQWFVETDDLTEIEVVNIEVGQEVTIVADALPDVELKGVVDSIAKKFEEKRGDVTYTVKIKLNEVDPRLRWGMTVAARFATK